MAKILDLQAKVRTAEGTSAVKRLRKAGSIPAVIYGKKHSNAKVEVNSKTFTAIIEHSASDNILVNLKIDGEANDALALVQEVQHDYLRGGILHVDFHAVAADEDIHASVPVVLSGIEAAEKKGGKLEFVLHSLEVHCLPKDLPESIALDVSYLNVGEATHVSELTLPEGVSTKLEGDVVVAILKEPLVAEEAPAPAADAKAPAKGKGAPAAKAAAPAAKPAGKK
ncbi:50S ribosomal protein L25 [Verrucomicrobium sp. BvORR034]|jgi:large subunit ribosomal protein L25|uniref:50S ribosomal protein L25 n=1 Tax=Verrucomicrobium sp. BvORR034 TaxID=1396418 RepID=UPI000678BE92|nr:50S ribosomal protein L25 [Verrucomicrobium sp. BvORR034]